MRAARFLRPLQLWWRYGFRTRHSSHPMRLSPSLGTGRADRREAVGCRAWLLGLTPSAVGEGRSVPGARPGIASGRGYRHEPVVRTRGHQGVVAWGSACGTATASSADPARPGSSTSTSSGTSPASTGCLALSNAPAATGPRWPAVGLTSPLPGANPSPALVRAAAQLRAAHRELHQRAEIEEAAQARVIVHAAARTGAELAHGLAEHAENPDLTGPARALSIRAHNDTHHEGSVGVEHATRKRSGCSPRRFSPTGWCRCPGPWQKD